LSVLLDLNLVVDSDIVVYVKPVFAEFYKITFLFSGDAEFTYWYLYDNENPSIMNGLSWILSYMFFDPYDMQAYLEPEMLTEVNLHFTTVNSDTTIYVNMDVLTPFYLLFDFVDPAILDFDIETYWDFYVSKYSIQNQLSIAGYSDIAGVTVFFYADSELTIPLNGAFLSESQTIFVVIEEQQSFTMHVTFEGQNNSDIDLIIYDGQPVLDPVYIYLYESGEFNNVPFTLIVVSGYPESALHHTADFSIVVRIVYII